MDSDRKHQIIAAEAAFASRERLARALAEEGFYVVGKLKTPALDLAIERRPFPSDIVAKPKASNPD